MAILQNPANHSQFIREYLELILQTPITEMKTMYTKILYDYMRVEGFDYVMRHQTFKAITIKKAYELKRECSDFIELENSLNGYVFEIENSLNCYLLAFGAPLEEVEVELEESEESELEESEESELEESEESDIEL